MQVYGQCLLTIAGGRVPMQKRSKGTGMIKSALTITHNTCSTQNPRMVLTNNMIALRRGSLSTFAAGVLPAQAVLGAIDGQQPHRVLQGGKGTDAMTTLAPGTVLMF